MLAGCSGRDLPDDPAPAPLSTGIPAAAPGAMGASFDTPAPALSPPPRMGPHKGPAPAPPPPLPPDPFGAEGVDDGDGGGPPAPPPVPLHPKKPPKPKGLTL